MTYQFFTQWYDETKPGCVGEGFFGSDRKAALKHARDLSRTKPMEDTPVYMVAVNLQTRLAHQDKVFENGRVINVSDTG